MHYDFFEETKTAVLEYVEQILEEVEMTMGMSHQEKVAHLEDSFQDAMDESELRVAFDQWFSEHVSDIDLEYDAHEMWDQAMSNIEELASVEA
jgi:hypothetical protein